MREARLDEGVDNLKPAIQGFPVAQLVKESAGNAGDLGSVPGLGRSPGGGVDNPLQYSCLENPTDKGAWQALQSMGSQRVEHKVMTT